MITTDAISQSGASLSADGAQRSEQLAILAGMTIGGAAPLPVTQSAQEANQLLAYAAPHLGQAVNQTV